VALLTTCGCLGGGRTAAAIFAGLRQDKLICALPLPSPLALALSMVSATPALWYLPRVWAGGQAGTEDVANGARRRGRAIGASPPRRISKQENRLYHSAH